MKITIEHEEKIWQGEAYPVPTKETNVNRTHKMDRMSESVQSPPYPKNSVAECVYTLKHKYKFFSGDAIKTTKEIIDQIKIKLNTTVKSNHAERDFYSLVRDGELERDKMLPSKNLPRGTYIWFLPETPKEKIEVYKKKFANESRTD